MVIVARSTHARARRGKVRSRRTLDRPPHRVQEPQPRWGEGRPPNRGVGNDRERRTDRGRAGPARAARGRTRPTELAGTGIEPVPAIRAMDSTNTDGTIESQPRTAVPRPRDERSEEPRSPRRPAGSPSRSRGRGAPTRPSAARELGGASKHRVAEEIDGEGSVDATERSEGAWGRGNTSPDPPDEQPDPVTSGTEPPLLHPHPRITRRPTRIHRTARRSGSVPGPLLDQESSSSGVWTLGTTGVRAGRAACRRPQLLGTPAGDDRVGWGPGRSRCVLPPGRPQDVPACARARPQARPHGDPRSLHRVIPRL